MLQKLIFLAAAGACGTLARYGLAGLVQRFNGTAFPWGTFAVNIVGCLLAGAVWAASENRVAWSGQTRVIVLVGFMGAFTTFSTLILETSHLARDSEWLLAVGNIVGQNVAGALALLVGLAIGRYI